VLLGQRAQVALHPAAAATVEQLDHAPAVEVGNHRREFAAAAVMRLVERQPPHRPRPATRLELVLRAGAESARNLVAARLLVAGQLGVSATAARPLEQAPPSAA
jgi:hypothetical protein